MVKMDRTIPSNASFSEKASLHGVRKNFLQLTNNHYFMTASPSSIPIFGIFMVFPASPCLILVRFAGMFAGISEVRLLAGGRQAASLTSPAWNGWHEKSFDDRVFVLRTGRDTVDNFDGALPFSDRPRGCASFQDSILVMGGLNETGPWPVHMLLAEEWTLAVRSVARFASAMVYGLATVVDSVFICGWSEVHTRINSRLRVHRKLRLSRAVFGVAASFLEECFQNFRAGALWGIDNK